MAMQHFPLIGIDRNKNEHEFECPGPTAKLAAQSGLRLYGYLQVLNGDKRNGLAHYRQSLARKPNAEFANEATPALAIALETSKTAAASELLTQLRGKGFRISLTEEEELLVTPRSKLTREDRLALQERAHTVLQLLKLEKNPPPKAVGEDLPVSSDPYNGESRRAVIAKILPQMPTPFTTAIFSERLIAAGFTAFAHDTQRVGNAVKAAVELGWVQSVKRGQYRVEPRFSEDQRAAAVPPHVAAPPANGLDAPAPSEAPPVAAIPAAETASLPKGVLQSLLLLSSQALLSKGPEEEMSKALLEAVNVFQTSVLQAYETLESALKPIALELQAQSAMRTALTHALIPH